MTRETVTVYEIPKQGDRIVCRQCDATEKKLVELNVPFVIKDATDPENNAFIKGLGFLGAPVVTVEVDGEIVDSWAGYNPEACKDLAYKLK